MDSDQQKQKNEAFLPKNENENENAINFREDNQNELFYSDNNTYKQSEQQQQQQQQKIESEKREDRNWFRRTFSPLDAGSIRGSIFSLTGLLLGVGVLALPKVATDSGIIVGIFYVVGSGLLGYFSLIVMMRASFATNDTTYTGITQKLLGNKFKFLLELAILFQCYGCSINYFITISTFFNKILQSFDLHYFETEFQQRAAEILYSTLIIFPASIPKNLSILHNFVALGIFSVLYLIVTVAIQTQTYYKTNFNWDNVNWINIDLRIFPGFCVCCFAYTCQFIVFPVVQELKNPTQTRITKLFSRSMFLNMAVYLLAMITGFLSLAKDAPDLITDRISLNGGKDIAMNIGRVFMVFHIFTSAPLLFIPCKNELYQLNFLKKRQGNKFVWILVTFLLVYSSAGIAIVFPVIYDFLSLLGGTCCVYMMILLPGQLYISLSTLPKTHWKNLTVSLGTYFLTLFGVVAAVLSFLRATKFIAF